MYTQQKIFFFKELIRCNYPLFFWQYDMEMNLIKSDCPQEEALDSLFTLTECKEYIRAHLDSADMPMLLSNPLGLMWVAAFEKEDETITAVHIMGPAFVNQNSLVNLERQLNQHNLAISTKQQILRQLATLPLISNDVLFQYAIMFHFCLRDERITFGDLHHQFRTPEPASSDAALADGRKNAASGNPQHTGIRYAEKQLLSMVSTGNLNYQEALDAAALVSRGIRSNVGDFLQQAKFSAISFLTLCSRAAIEGGLPAATSYDLMDLYGETIDNCKTPTEITVVNNTMFEDYITRVHKCRQSPDVSAAVRICCDYIQMHLKEELDIDTLADMTGYTSYYLSRRFKKEMGVSINNYIRKQRVEASKTLLSATDCSISEISEQFCFCSRSYYADVFQKETGVSPSAWREKHRS